MKKLAWTIAVSLSCLCNQKAFTNNGIMHEPPESCRELFERTLDTNVQRCAEVLAEQEGTTPEEVCARCRRALETAFRIDSTFIKMNPDEQAAFFDRHRDALYPADGK